MYRLNPCSDECEWSQVEEGIVPGGGTALLYSSLCIDKLIASDAGKNFDQKHGMQVA